ncbi:MAG: ABC transporter ATP-binding protein [Lysobacterales bacterium]|nr:MAG: ABC transporter ATP-binding protein [Xanthomonadales bacterium]
MIRTEHITYRIGAFSLRDVSVDIARGEYFVLLGPPGAGKTLLLEALCGLRRVESGHLYIDGKDVTQLEPRERMVGYVPQDYALFTHRTVDGNIRFGLDAQGVGRSNANQRVQYIADLLGIAHLLPRTIAGLSGGERQRIALARALVVRPKVLLLDEPVSALDESTRENVCRELRRVQREFNVTTIHVSHHLEEAFSVADRAGILRDGSFQQVDTLHELLRHPVNTFVAGFMRCQNILPAHVVGPADREGWVTVALGQQQFALPGLYSGKVQIVLRPERIMLTPTSHTPGIRLPATVQRVVDRGVYTHVELDASFPLVAHVHQASGDSPLAPKTEITAVIRPEDVHVIPG